MKLRPFLPDTDFDAVKSWITDERTHALWCAGRFAYPPERENFLHVLRDSGAESGGVPLIMAADDGKAAILTSYTGEDRDVTFPAEVENGIPVIRIDDGMCSDNPVIVNLRIPGSIKRIGNAAFSRCPNLRSVVIEEGVEIIGMCSFGGCAELVEIQLPDSLTEVDNCVFAFCPELKEVTFGSRMTRIGAQAFYGCENLVRITVPGGSQVTFGDGMFEQCPNEVEIIY